MKDFRDSLRLLVCCKGTFKQLQICWKNSFAISSTALVLQVSLYLSVNVCSSFQLPFFLVSSTAASSVWICSEILVALPKTEFVHVSVHDLKGLVVRSSKIACDYAGDWSYTGRKLVVSDRKPRVTGLKIRCTLVLYFSSPIVYNVQRASRNIVMLRCTFYSILFYNI